jgi:glycosyltransferase involved in cell wall biosynthesis
MVEIRRLHFGAGRWDPSSAMDNARPLRITCVIGPFLPVPPLLGGAVERIWYTLCRKFAGRGHEVTLISRRYPGLADRETVEGIRHIRLPSRDAPAVGFSYRFADLVYATRVCRAMPASDVTITNSVSLPLILPKAAAGRIYASIARYPKRQLQLYGRVDRFHAVSHAVGGAIRAMAPRFADRVAVIPNALSDAFAAEAEREAESGNKEIIFVGRIAAEKGVDLLVKAFVANASRWPGWRLKLVGPWAVEAGGDGDGYRRYLEELALPCGDAIEFTGPIFDEQALIRTMAGARLFVYPSVAEFGESFGMAPLEAMASGCAVIVSKLDCFLDFAEDGHNCVVFDHRSNGQANLAVALDTLIGDRELRVALSLAAKQTAHRFTPDKIADRFLADFQQLCQPSFVPK